MKKHDPLVRRIMNLQLDKLKKNLSASHESLAFAKEAVTEAKLELAACEAELTKAKRAYAEIANWLEKN